MGATKKPLRAGSGTNRWKADTRWIVYEGFQNQIFMTSIFKTELEAITFMEARQLELGPASPTVPSLWLREEAVTTNTYINYGRDKPSKYKLLGHVRKLLIKIDRYTKRGDADIRFAARLYDKVEAALKEAETIDRKI